MQNNPVSCLVVTDDEAPAAIKSTKRTMARWRAEGVGPKFIKVGRKVVYRMSDLDDWLTQQTRTSTAQRTRR